MAQQVDPQQANQGDILLVADPAAVDDVGLDLEAAAAELMGEGARDGIGVRIVLKDDDVLFTPVPFKDFHQSRCGIIGRRRFAMFLLIRHGMELLGCSFLIILIFI